MQSRALPPKDRAGAVADAFALASAGKLGMGVALDLASKLRDDPDNLVRQTVVMRLVGLISLYSEVRVPELAGGGRGERGRRFLVVGQDGGGHSTYFAKL